MVSGFITSVQGKAIGNNFVVIGKVRHSQRMNDTPVPIWIIANNEGTVLSALCLACKAGLAECCSHRKRPILHRSMEPHTRKVSLHTQVKCTWLLPTYVNEVPYSEVKDINFKSAKKLKTELDDRIDDLCQSFTTQIVKPTVKPVVEAPIPSQAEMKALFSEVNKSSKKPVILSLVPEFSEQFVLKSPELRHCQTFTIMTI